MPYSYYPFNYWHSGRGHIPVVHLADDGFGNLKQVPDDIKFYNYKRHIQQIQATE